MSLSNPSTAQFKLGTRAVERQIEAGNTSTCVYCDELVKFMSKQKAEERRQIIANVYWRGKWHRTEHYHKDCYRKAGSPHGPVIHQAPHEINSNGRKSRKPSLPTLQRKKAVER